MKVINIINSLAKKIKSSDSNLSDLSSEFQKLRAITIIIPFQMMYAKL